MTTKPATLTGTQARPRLRGALPGPKGKKVVAADGRFLSTSTKVSPLVVAQAKGANILTVDGDVLLDFTSGVGVLNVGHAHPAVVKAVQDQAARFTHMAGADYYYEVQVELAQRLAKLVPGAIEKKTFFTNSGTESNEAALKAAAWTSKRRGFLAYRRAFHGRTLGSLALTNSKTVQRERFPTIGGVHHVPFPDPYRNPFHIDGYEEPGDLVERCLESVEDVLQTTLPPAEAAAMFVEPVQGEGGYNFPPRAYFPKLHKLLKGHGILLVSDEIQTGIGRTGKLFAMEHYGVKPDITTLAKGLGSGMPIGAAVMSASLDFGVSGAHSNTFGGNPVACASAVATLDVLEEEKLVARAARLGPGLGKRLREAVSGHPAVGDVRGLGFMWAVDLVKDQKSKEPDKALRDRLVEAAFQRGLVALPCGRSVVRVIPPLVATQEQLDVGCEILGDALKAASK